MKVNLDWIGSDKQPLWIVDDFVPNAAGLIEYALSHSPVSADPGLYPGLRSPAPAAYTQYLLSQVNRLLAQCAPAEPVLSQGKSYYSMVTTPPQALRPAQSVPHFDRPESAQYAVMHFLCGEQHGGTGFYRHRATGYECINRAREAEYLTCLEQELQSALTVQGYINGSNHLFEQIARVGARFNRALVYRCSSLHSGCIDEDYQPVMDPYRGRFTLTSFLE